MAQVRVYAVRCLTDGQDIRNQRIYRRQRKQELAKLQTTLDDLTKKKAFFDEQNDYYDKYVEACMGQLTKKPVKSVRHSMMTCSQCVGSVGSFPDVR